MPIDPERDDHEAELALILLVWSQRTREDLLRMIRAGATPESIDKGSYWQELQDRMARAIAPRVNVIALRAGEAAASEVNQNQDSVVAMVYASLVVATQGQRYSGWQVSSIRERLSKDFHLIEEGVAVEELLEDAVRDRQANNLAVSLTTDVTTHAETLTIEGIRQQAEDDYRNGGGRGTFQIVALWHKEDDEACPICSMLDGKLEFQWPAEYRAGPKAHPNCRCWLSWHVMIDGEIQAGY